MSEYIKQAKDFLEKTNTTIIINLSEEQKDSNWSKKEDHLTYDVEIKNQNHKYKFNYWSSKIDKEIYDLIQENKKWSFYNGDARAFEKLNQKLIQYKNLNKNEKLNKKLINEFAEKAIEPNEYDILACLNMVEEDNFEDWCSSYGYETDSRKAYQTYLDVCEQDRNLRKLFDRKELELLQEIL